MRTWKRQAGAVREFYRKRDYEPIWINSNGLGARAAELLKTLSRSKEEGLDPNHYLPKSLSSFEDRAQNLSDDWSALARLELELSLAALAYARHASAGQVNPSKISRDMDVHPQEANPATVLGALAKSARPSAYLNSLLPSHPAYRQLRSELAKLQAISEPARSLARVPGGRVLKVGQIDERVPVIRERLIQMGLLGELELSLVEEPVDHNDAVNEHRFEQDRRTLLAIKRTYDAGMALAVKEFQSSKGLSSDGIVGKRTIASLDRPLDD